MVRCQAPLASVPIEAFIVIYILRDWAATLPTQERLLGIQIQGMFSKGSTRERPRLSARAPTNSAVSRTSAKRRRPAIRRSSFPTLPIVGALDSYVAVGSAIATALSAVFINKMSIRKMSLGQVTRAPFGRFIRGV